MHSIHHGKKTLIRTAAGVDQSAAFTVNIFTISCKYKHPNAAQEPDLSPTGQRKLRNLDSENETEAKSDLGSGTERKFKPGQTSPSKQVSVN